MLAVEVAAVAVRLVVVDAAVGAIEVTTAGLFLEAALDAVDAAAAGLLRVDAGLYAIGGDAVGVGLVR
ncbi:hypothetical protein D3C85_1816700 [compost metagenome]